MAHLNYSQVTSIFVTTDFIGFHRWPTAPERRAYLRNLHRHLFGVEVTIEVTHDDREIEYHDLKGQLDQFIITWQAQGWRESSSCEVIAEAILDWLKATYPNRRHYLVEVNEDGENGSVVEARV